MGKWGKGRKRGRGKGEKEERGKKGKKERKNNRRAERVGCFFFPSSISLSPAIFFSFPNGYNSETIGARKKSKKPFESPDIGASFGVRIAGLTANCGCQRLVEKGCAKS